MYMKKLLLACSLALFGVINAQVKFGVKGGYSLANLKFRDWGDISPNSKSTFYVGALVEIKVSNKAAIQGELAYSFLGADIKESLRYGNYFADFKSKKKIGTLSIPVLFKYYPFESGLALLGGVNLGFITSAKEKNTVDYNVPLSSQEQNMLNSFRGNKDVKSNFKSVDLAPFIGAEYNFSNGLFIETRYNIGATNIYNIGPDMIGDVPVSKTPKAYNRYWQLGLGYKF